MCGPKFTKLSPNCPQNSQNSGYFETIPWYNQVGNESILKNMSSVIVLFQKIFDKATRSVEKSVIW